MKKQSRTPLFGAPQLKPRRTAPPKAGFWIVRAVTRSGSNRQRAEPRPNGESATDHRTRVVRGAVIIFGAHILAIALYFVHLNFLGGKTDDSTTATRTEPQLPAAAAGDRPLRMEIISSGDTWATIAVRTGVDEARLREVNKGRPFENGRSLIIPDENAGAVPPPSSSEARLPRGADDGLVDVIPEVLDPADADHTGPLAEPPPPRAVVVQEPAARPAAVRTSGRTHKVKSGETLWRISNLYKVDQRKLMELNGIKDPNKLAAGATLKIPD